MAKIFFWNQGKINHIKQIKFQDKVSSQNILRRLAFNNLWLVGISCLGQ
jgi:hypothetical protein